MDGVKPVQFVRAKRSLFTQMTLAIAIISQAETINYISPQDRGIKMFFLVRLYGFSILHNKFDLSTLSGSWKLIEILITPTFFKDLQ